MTTSLLGRVTRRSVQAVRFGMPWWAQSLRALHGTVTVLLYHRVCQFADSPWLEAGGVPYTLPDAFRRQLTELKDHGGEFFTLEQLLEGAWPEPSRPGFVVTFDDGFDDNFSTACPILDELNVPAVFFVTAAMPARQSLLWEHLLFRLSKEPSCLAEINRLTCIVLGKPVMLDRTIQAVRSLLSPEQADDILESVAHATPDVHTDATSLYPEWKALEQANRNGHQIAAHTTSHRMRHTMTQKQFEDEIGVAKDTLQNNIDCEVTAMSYPYNGYFFMDAEICLATGYKQVATVDPGRLNKNTSSFWIPRRTVFRAHNRQACFRELVASEGF
jgi:peptidoglycan/xylan/chitin deacetylase (PgdA/CDA1 family)